MQQWKLSGGVVGVLLGALTIFGCSSDEDTKRPTLTGANVPAKRDVTNASVPLNGTTASGGGTAILNDETFTVPSSVLANNATPASLANALKGQTKTDINFSKVSGANGTATLTNPTASGTVKFASCEFTITAPKDLAGTIFIKDCTVTVNASNVPTGGNASGTATLNMNGVPSAPVTVTVTVDPNGVVKVNDTPTNIVLPPVTGATGGSKT